MQEFVLTGVCLEDTTVETSVYQYCEYTRTSGIGVFLRENHILNSCSHQIKQNKR